jgi:hemolysin activation/secretion protein
VKLEGAFADMADANKKFIGTVAGRRLTVAQIYQAAQALEAAYAQADYILVRVALPPQELVDGGTLRLIIVDGFIEAIEAKGVPERVRHVVVARTRALIGKRHIKLGEIERRLLIAGDAPGLRLRSTIARGQQEGGTKLILEGIYRTVTGSLSADNRLPAPLGSWSYTASLSLNSLFGMGEQIYGSFTAPNPLKDTFNDAARIRVVGAGMIIPLGVDGWTLNPEYTLSRTRAVALLGAPDGVAWFERWAVRTSYPITRTRTTTFMLQGAFEAITQYTDAFDFGTELNRDRYTVLRAGADNAFPLPWGTGGFQSTWLFSRGLGGRDQNDAAASTIPLTRQGAGPVFSKLSGTVRIQQPLPETFQLALIGRGQTTFNNPVLRSEQFALDAPDGVSSFPSGTFMVDEGVSGRVELARPFDWRTPEFTTTLIPYVFGATSKGYLRMPTAVETSSIQASSIGGGLRTGSDQLSNFNSHSAAVEFGKQYSDYPGFAAGYRTTAILSVKF